MSRPQITFLFLLSFALLSSCSFLAPKKSIDDPLKDFFEDSPPKYVEASLGLTEKGREELKKENFALATEHFNKALTLDPYNPFAYYFLGSLSYQRKNYQESLGFLYKTIQFSKKFLFWKSQAYLLSGLNWKALNNRKMAKTYFKKAKLIDPKIDLPPLD